MRKIGITVVKCDLSKPVLLDKVARIPVAPKLIVNVSNYNRASQRPVVSKFREAEVLLVQSRCFLLLCVKVTARMQADSDS
jgi:hypothetical protein